MSERNGDSPHKTATVTPPLGRPFSPGHDPRRNTGGRPRGLAAAVRAVVGDDGRALIEFHLAIMNADTKALRVRQVALKDRLAAAAWLSDRAFGRPPHTVELTAIEREESTTALQAIAADLTVEERATIREILMARRERLLAQQRAEAEARMRSFLPEPGGNGDAPQRL